MEFLDSTNYTIVPVDTDIVQTALNVDDVPELHDRIIAASQHAQVIW